MRTIDWSFLEERFGAVYDDKPIRPPLPTRLIAGLGTLKHTPRCCASAGWNPPCPFLSKQVTVTASAAASEPSVATRIEVIKPSDRNRFIVDTTVQPKNVISDRC